MTVNRLEINYWWWLSISFGSVGLLALIGILDQIPLWWFILALIVYLGVALPRRIRPISLCVLCSCSLEGLSEPVCPRCGGDFRKGRPMGITGYRRVFEAALLSFLVAWLAFLMIPLLIMDLLPSTTFRRGPVRATYAIQIATPPGPGEQGVSVFVFDEDLVMSVAYDTYPNEAGEPCAATVTARLDPRVPEVPKPRVDLFAAESPVPVVDPGWTGDLDILPLAINPRSVNRPHNIATTSPLDVDALVEAVLDDRLSRDQQEVAVDPRARAILSEPASREALKSSLKKAWAAGLETGGAEGEQALGPAHLRWNSRLAVDDGSRSVPCTLYVSGGSIAGDESYLAYSPWMIIEYRIMLAIGFFILSLGVAAIMRWYGSPPQKLSRYLSGPRPGQEVTSEGLCAEDHRFEA